MIEALTNSAFLKLQRTRFMRHLISIHCWKSCRLLIPLVIKYKKDDIFFNLNSLTPTCSVYQHSDVRTRYFDIFTDRTTI